MMMQWNELHAYNAVHVVRIPGRMDPAGIKTAIQSVLDARQLGELVIDGRRGIYEYQGGRAKLDIQFLLPGEDPQKTLQTEIQRQLNTRFDWDRPLTPFRFFVLPQQGAFLLGMAYFHPVADAEAVVYLMREITEAVQTPDRPHQILPVDLYPPRRDGFLLRHPGLLLKRLINIPSSMRAMRCANRPFCRDSQNHEVGFVQFTLQPDVFAAAKAASKSWDVTINDLFIAVMMKTLAVMPTDRFKESRRRDISFGSIVNLRKDVGLEGQNIFGLYLGSFVVTHHAPPEISLQNLAADIRDQTRRIKQTKLYIGGRLQMGIARFVLSLLSLPRRKKFYQKHYPLWGGITNMNVNMLWNEPSPGVDYFRAVSTGPVTPMVLSVTTFGKAVNIGISHRTSMYSAGEMNSIIQQFQQILESIGVKR